MNSTFSGNVRPQQPPISWEQFVKDYPPFSIALDGFVADGPKFQSSDEGGPRLNFNHHEGVDRDSTVSTTMQVSIALRTGMLEDFNDCGNPCFTWEAIDCDEDVCMSTWQLENIELARPVINLRLNRMVSFVNYQDMFSGLWPMPCEANILREQAFIFYPYRRARLDGTIDRRNPVEFEQIIHSVHSRIREYYAGNGGTMDLKMKYDVIGGGPGWHMIREIGEHARYALLGDGIKAFISVRERENGNYSYSFCRLSKFITGFPLPYILQRNNEVEGLVDSPHKYGGGTNTGGSPLLAGTPTPPAEMASRVNEFIAEWKSRITKPELVSV
jgi:hypothetical protein